MTEYRLRVPRPRFLTVADYGAVWLARYQRDVMHVWYIEQLGRLAR